MVPLIDFRYHVITVVSIFLALAVGLLIGSTAFSDDVVHDLRGRVNGLVQDKADLQTQVETEQGRSGSDEAFIKAASARLVSGTLTARRVTVVSLPGADSGQRTQVLDMLTAAGATVSLQLQLTDKVDDPASATTLTALATQIGTLPAGTAAADQGVAALAAGTVGVVDTSVVTKVLAAYGDSTAGFLTVTGSAMQAGQSVVILLPGVADGKASDPQVLARRALALQLAKVYRDRMVPVVVAGPTSATDDGGGIKAIRDDGSRTGISTVDSLDDQQGSVATALALSLGFTGKTGQYGTGPGASSPYPTGS